jgi:hypothetical protein
MSTFFHFDAGFFKPSGRTRFFPEPYGSDRLEIFFEPGAAPEVTPDLD